MRASTDRLVATIAAYFAAIVGSYLQAPSVGQTILSRPAASRSLIKRWQARQAGALQKRRPKCPAPD
jgi:hypothetical protein